MTTGTIPFHAFPAVVTESWDHDAAEKRVRAWATVDGKFRPAQYALAFAWIDPEKRELLGGHKLLHHDIRHGKLVTVWGGVKAAGNAVQGARHELLVPPADLPGIKRHLEKEYALFGRVAPWQKKGPKVGTVKKSAPTARRSRSRIVKWM